MGPEVRLGTVPKSAHRAVLKCASSAGSDTSRCAAPHGLSPLWGVEVSLPAPESQALAKPEDCKTRRVFVTT